MLRGTLTLVLVLTSSAVTAKPLSLVVTPVDVTPTIGVLSFDTGLSAEDLEKGWLVHRLPDLTEESLRRLGVATPDRAFVGNGPWEPQRVAARGLDAVVSGRVTPPGPTDAGAKVTVELKIVTQSEKPVYAKVEGVVSDLEALAAKVASRAAQAIGVTVSANAFSRSKGARTAYRAHRFLGEGSASLASGEYRRALMKFDRAQASMPSGILPEAWSGAQKARASLQSLKSDHTTDRTSDLAESALEKAEVMLRNKKYDEAVRSMISFLRYTKDRAHPWNVEIPLNPKTSLVIDGGELWWVQQRGGALIELEPDTGTVRAIRPAVRGLVGATKRHLMTLNGRTLARHPVGGRPQWEKKMPFAPEISLLPVIGGAAAIFGEGRLLWVDVGLGNLGQVALGVKVLAVGSEGILVDTTDKKKRRVAALLRPGREVPAWRVPLPDGEVAARMIHGRVALIAKGKLTGPDTPAEPTKCPTVSIVDVRNGKVRTKSHELSKGARWLGAQGRYGVTADDRGKIVVFDLLAGTKTAELRGPGRPVASMASSASVAVVFDTSDVLAFDRDGVFLDRARVEGVPFSVVAGSALTPGPVVVTTRGLFAFGEIPEGRRTRDVDVLYLLAETLEKTKKREAALRVAEYGAAMNAGRVAELETLRARLLDRINPKAAKHARARAEAAKDLSKPLPPFKAH